MWTCVDMRTQQTTGLSVFERERAEGGCIFWSSLGIRDSLRILPESIDFIEFYLGKIDENKILKPDQNGLFLPV